MRAAELDDAVRAGARAVAAALLPELPAISAGVAVHIIAGEPGYTRSGAEDLVRRSCQANCAIMLDGLLREVPLDVIGPSAEVVWSTREFVHYGVSLTSVERGYRLGIAWWCARWAAAVQVHCPDPAIAVPVTSAGTTYLLGWLDRVLERLGAEVRDEAQRLAREGALAQVEEVRGVLAADRRIDSAAASRRLGYDLTGHHLALVLRQTTRSGDNPSLDAAARTIAVELNGGRPLVVRADVATAWCWVPLRAGATASTPAPVEAVIGGHGGVAAGIEGFRSSHREAQEALRVALLAEHGPGTMTGYPDVAIASLCSIAPGWAQDFVAAQLGPLAADDSAASYRRRNCSNARSGSTGLPWRSLCIWRRISGRRCCLGRPRRTPSMITERTSFDARWPPPASRSSHPHNSGSVVESPVGQLLALSDRGDLLNPSTDRGRRSRTRNRNLVRSFSAEPSVGGVPVSSQVRTAARGQAGGQTPEIDSAVDLWGITDRGNFVSRIVPRRGSPDRASNCRRQAYWMATLLATRSNLGVPLNTRGTPRFVVIR